MIKISHSFKKEVYIYTIVKHNIKHYDDKYSICTYVDQ